MMNPKVRIYSKVKVVVYTKCHNHTYIKNKNVNMSVLKCLIVTIVVSIFHLHTI